jgi:hypothetical protein
MLLNFMMYFKKPNQKEEAWKYTSLNTILDFTVFPNKTITFNILM